MPGRKELKCKIFPFGSQKDLMFVVICSLYNGKYMLSRHKKRDTWEHQGGHIEAGESPEEAARRELFEESGVTDASILPLCDYIGYDDTGFAAGAVFLAVIHSPGELPESEMAEVRFFDKFPDNLTYPLVTPKLMEKAIELAKREHSI